MAEKDYRIEPVSMGEVRVPKTAYYGTQMQRGEEFSDQRYQFSADIHPHTRPG